MKKLLSILGYFLLLGSVHALAQMTTITATVTDSDSTAWANAHYQLSLVFGHNCTQLSCYYINGAPLNPTIAFQSGNLNSSGQLSTSVYTTNMITPSGTSWFISVCSDTSNSSCSPQVFFTATGGTQDISSLINAAITAPRFPGIAGNFGYADVEVSNLNPGATYYNNVIPCTRNYNGSTWSCAGAGSFTGSVVVGCIPEAVTNTTTLTASPICDNGTSLTSTEDFQVNIGGAAVEMSVGSGNAILTVIDAALGSSSAEIETVLSNSDDSASEVSMEDDLSQAIIIGIPGSAAGTNPLSGADNTYLASSIGFDLGTQNNASCVNTQGGIGTVNFFTNGNEVAWIGCTNGIFTFENETDFQGLTVTSGISDDGGIATPLIQTGTNANSNNQGTITLSSGTGSHSLASLSHAPVCTYFDTTTPAHMSTMVATVSSSSITITNSVGTSDVYNYICWPTT